MASIGGIFAAVLTAPVLVLSLPGPAQASEADFLESLEGTWTGGGVVRLKPGSDAVDVSCTLDSKASGASLSMDGRCRGMLVFSRRIGAELRAQGNSYEGSYVGASGGAAALSGTRDGETLNLQVDWANRGDAEMRLSNLGNGRMQLTTVEPHPRTGEAVVTARLDLTRQ